MSNQIHSSANISELASLDVSIKGTSIIVGENCVIDDYVKIKHVAGNEDVVLGDYVYLNSGTVIYSGNGVNIGSHVLIGPNCSLVPVNHNFENTNELIRLQGFMPSKGGILIRDNVWIGAGVTIIDGVEIGEGAVIGAGSLVNDNVPPFTIYAGTPAKKIGTRN